LNLLPSEPTWRLLSRCRRLFPWQYWFWGILLTGDWDHVWIVRPARFMLTETCRIWRSLFSLLQIRLK
jgi:hypothetical protein